MLMQKYTQVSLKKTYNKILYLYEAYNETFVFLGMMGVKRDCLVHVNKHGKQLFCYYFDRPMDSLGMMNQYQAITMQTRANCITILDLKTYQFRRVPHYFMAPESDQSLLYTFADTRYMCIIQHGRYNDNRIHISYYNYPQVSKAIYHRKQILQKQFTSTQKQWTYQYQIVKGNSHSMVLWYKARHDEVFQFKLFKQDSNFMSKYTLNRQNSNGWEFKQYRIQHKFAQIYQNNRLNIAVNQVFQIQKDKLMVCCLTNRERPLIQTQPIKNTYIVDLLTSSIQQSPHNLGALHQFQIDRYLLGNCHMIRTFNFKNNQSLSSPVYYFSNNTFQLVSKSQWICSYKSKYTFPGYDSHTMIQCEYQNAMVKEFKCWYKKIIQYKEIIMFFLLEINQDFDDDLMQDVIQLICL